MTYETFKSRTVEGQPYLIPIDELLRILLSGFMPDGSAFSGIKIASASSVTGTVAVSGVTLPSTVVNGQETVDAAGTAQAIGASTALTSGVTVKALLANSDNIYVGDSSVDDTNGYELDAGESVFVETDNLANIYIDADTNDDGVSYIGG